jgi:hypothetical protein
MVAALVLTHLKPQDGHGPAQGLIAHKGGVRPRAHVAGVLGALPGGNEVPLVHSQSIWSLWIGERHLHPPLKPWPLLFRSYEECVGPGATQLYVPMDAPPPYSLTDSCPTLNGALDSSSGHSHSGHQPEQRTRGQSGLRTISMDMLPPYEAVCGAGSPSDLLPLPGPEPRPRNSQGSPIPPWSSASSPERVV